MAITAKQIAEAARMSKRVCHAEGHGRQVLVWPDGGVSEATSATDILARLRDDGSRTYPLLRLRYPMTRAQVREALCDSLVAQARDLSGAPDAW